MSARNATLAAVALALLAGRATAQQLDPKKFVEQVRPILLPDEEKQWKGLKDSKDKEEFQKIFWARRDPDLDTPANEYRAEYEKARADADQRFNGTGRPGAETDCGRVLILLGLPDEATTGEGGHTKLDTPKLVRQSQSWIYKDRPGLKFKDGKVEIGFDEACALPQGARLGDQLARVAESKIAHPNLDYKKGADGHLVKLEDQLPKPTPVMALLKAPRQDFPLAAENGLLLRTPDGATYVAGLARVDKAAVTVEGASARVSAAAQAVGADGKVAATSEKDMKADVGPDGGVLVSYGMALKPGDYTLKVAVFDGKTGKGSTLSQPLKVPDFNADELSISPLLVLRDVQEVPNDPTHGLAAYQLGTTRLVPHYGNVFSAADSITLLAFIYGGRKDETTGKPSLLATFTITKDGAPVARAPEQTFDTTPTGPSVGPVPLTNYKPGKYTVQVKVTDKVAKKDYTSDATFEVK